MLLLMTLSPFPTISIHLGVATNVDNEAVQLSFSLTLKESLRPLCPVRVQGAVVSDHGDVWRNVTIHCH